MLIDGMEKSVRTPLSANHSIGPGQMFRSLRGKGRTYDEPPKLGKFMKGGFQYHSVLSSRVTCYAIALGSA